MLRNLTQDPNLTQRTIEAFSSARNFAGKTASGARDKLFLTLIAAETLLSQDAYSAIPETQAASVNSPDGLIQVGGGIILGGLGAAVATRKRKVAYATTVVGGVVVLIGAATKYL